LVELKKYLCGTSDIHQLRKVIEANPKYDKKGLGLVRSHTGKLLDKALLVKGHTLSPSSKASSLI